MPQSFADALAAIATPADTQPPSFADALASIAIPQSVPSATKQEHDLAEQQLNLESPPRQDEIGPGNLAYSTRVGPRHPVMRATAFEGPVTVTDAPANAVKSGRLVSAKTGAVSQARPYGTEFADLPFYEGLKQVATAIPPLSEKAGRVLTHPEEGVIPSEETLKQMNDVLDGMFKTASPLVIGGAIAQPVRTALAVAKGLMFQQGGIEATKALGASPELQKFAGNIAMATSGIVDTRAALTKGDIALTEVGRKVGETFRRVTEEKPYIDVKAGTPAPEPAEPIVAPQAGERTLPAAPPERPQNAPVTPPSPTAPPQVAPGELAPETPETRLASLQRVEPGNSRAVPFRVDVSPLADQLTQAAQGIKPVERDVPMGGVVATQPSVDADIVTNYTKTRAPLTGKLPTVVEWQNQFYLIDGTHRAVAEWATGQPTIKANVITVDPAKVAEIAAPRPPTPPSGVIKTVPEVTAAGKNTAFADALLSVAEPAKFSSTQVQLPPAIGKRLASFAASIPDEALAKDGREDDPHVTVKYGIHSRDVADVRKVLEGEPPIRVKLGKTSTFPDSGQGVVLKDYSSHKSKALRG